MGKFDEAWKRFFSDPARFADIVNVYCHEGRQVIKAEDIRDADSAQGSCMRDTVRKIVSGQEIMICGIESQEDMDPSMAWRVMGYDYREYEKQIRSIRKRNIQLFAKNGSNHQGSHSQGATDVFVSRDKVQGISDIPAKSEKEITSGEYMRKFLKTDRLRPVGTIIIYSGGKWDGPRSIWELCGLSQEKAERLEIVNDYPLHIIELRELKDEYINLFVTDIKQVFKVLKNMGDGNKIKQEIASDEKYDYLDKDAGKLIGVYCGKEAEKLLLKKEEETMSSIREDFEKMMAEEREEGREEGRKAAAEEIKAAKKETATARREAAAAKADGIKGMVMDNLEENVPRERVVLKLKKYFAISQEEAENYTLKYGYKTA